MPNHIKNRIILSGELSDIDAMIKAFGKHYKAEISKAYDDTIILLKENADVMWFNPKTGITVDRQKKEYSGIPEGYEIDIKDSVFAFPDFNLVTPHPNTPAYRDEPNQQVAQSDSTWWRTWNIENWGTKWSGYAYERLSINAFTFETAWSSVPMIIEKMSKTFPEVTIEYAWSDEDFGYNCGKAIYCNGLLTEHIPTGGTTEAISIALDLRPERKQYYKLVDGDYLEINEN